MHAMVLKKIGAALEWTELADLQPGPGEIRIKVAACGVCRTDLHVVDGELPNPHVPIIPGHEIVGRVDALGPGVGGLSIGEQKLKNEETVVSGIERAVPAFIGLFAGKNVGKMLVNLTNTPAA